jgi:hypothetical protein
LRSGRNVEVAPRRTLEILARPSRLFFLARKQREEPMPRKQAIAKKTDEQTNGEKCIRPVIAAATLTPPADELSTFTISEKITDAQRESFSVRFSIPTVYGSARDVELETPLRAWFAREIRAAMPDEVADDLIAAIAAQATIDFEHDLLKFVVGILGFVRKVAQMKATTAITDRDHRPSHLETSDFFDVTPSPANIFDATTSTRAIRAELIEEFVALFEQLMPISKGRAPERLPAEQIRLEADVRRDFAMRRRLPHMRERKRPTSAEIFHEMSNKRYGPRGEFLTESMIERIVFPRKRRPRK